MRSTADSSFRSPALARPATFLWTLVLIATACGADRGAIRKQDGRHQGTKASRRTDDKLQDFIRLASTHRDCDQEQIECFNACWSSTPPWPYKKGDKSYGTYCANLCLKKYMQCVEELKSRPVSFSSMQQARDWVSEHETELLIGTVILVSGAAFIVGTGGSGALILIPIAVAL
ncbi:hypothetical protein G4177_26265 [Corallococcus sp. ZKHCc1 1396]|uniref:Kazal-like domain-containing protein n=1 Tax=Corallococcus soli TaxID=2710757 RepID=A0ABR9PUS2_9BACT|nr:hypothetical protein [Corallococcus soli]